MSKTIVMGSTVSAWIEVKSNTGALVDPVNLILRIQQPNGTELPSIPKASLTRTATGKYEYEIEGSIIGKWWVRWEATNPNRAVEDFFTVKASQFT